MDIITLYFRSSDKHREYLNIKHVFEPYDFEFFFSKTSSYVIQGNLRGSCMGIHMEKQEGCRHLLT